MIKFGSCTEVYVPISFCVKVKAGDRVKGGVSIVGENNQSKKREELENYENCSCK